MPEEYRATKGLVGRRSRNDHYTHARMRVKSMNQTGRGLCHAEPRKEPVHDEDGLRSVEGRKQFRALQPSPPWPSPHPVCHRDHIRLLLGMLKYLACRRLLSGVSSRLPEEPTPRLRPLPVPGDPFSRPRADLPRESPGHNPVLEGPFQPAVITVALARHYSLCPPLRPISRICRGRAACQEGGVVPERSRLGELPFGQREAPEGTRPPQRPDT